MLGQTAPVNTGWGSCSSCVGSTYVDQSGNATGNGTALVSPGINVGSNAGSPCTINGWIIAAALGVVALVAMSSDHKKKGAH